MNDLHPPLPLTHSPTLVLSPFSSISPLVPFLRLLLFVCPPAGRGSLFCFAPSLDWCFTLILWCLSFLSVSCVSPPLNSRSCHLFPVSLSPLFYPAALSSSFTSSLSLLQICFLSHSYSHLLMSFLYFLFSTLLHLEFS